MKGLLFFLVFNLSLNFSSVFAEEISQLSTDSLDERLTDLELKMLASKINWGLDLKIGSSYMMNKSSIVGSTPTSNRGFVGSILFRLNAHSQVSSNLNVYAAIESLSLFNESLFTNSANISNRENEVKGEKLTVSKAYLDWQFYQNWIIFSAGRLPTTMGPPLHLKDGADRLGTYPVTAYSLPLDGFAITAKLNKPIDMKDNLSLRLIYTPGGQSLSGSPYRGALTGDYRNPGVVAKNHRMYSGMLEFEQAESYNKIWGKMLAIVQFGYYQFASPQAFNGTGVRSSADLDLYRIYFDNNKLIDAKIITPYIEFNKVLSTPLDLYATMSITNSHSKAKVRAVKISGPGSFPAGTDFEVGSFLHAARASGTRFLMGARYEFIEKTFIGTEFMKSTEKSLPTIFYADSSFTPNNLNGKSYEVYILRNIINNKFIARLGYVHIDINADLTNNLFYRDTQEKIDVVSLNFDIRI